MPAYAPAARPVGSQYALKNRPLLCIEHYAARPPPGGGTAQAFVAVGWGSSIPTGVGSGYQASPDVSRQLVRGYRSARLVGMRKTARAAAPGHRRAHRPKRTHFSPEQPGYALGG